MRFAIYVVLFCSVAWGSGCATGDKKPTSTPDGGVPQKQMSPEMKAKYEADMKANRERMGGTVR